MKQFFFARKFSKIFITNADRSVTRAKIYNAGQNYDNTKSTFSYETEKKNYSVRWVTFSFLKSLFQARIFPHISRNKSKNEFEIFTIAYVCRVNGYAINNVIRLKFLFIYWFFYYHYKNPKKYTTYIVYRLRALH